MNNKEIIEGNKLIAEFMNININFWNRKWFINTYASLKYHSSWDCLMTVIEKIESLGFFTSITVLADNEKDGMQNLVDERYYCGIDSNDYWGDSKINTVWFACVEFIKILKKK